MSQAENDLAQLKSIMKELAGVYKTQCHDEIMDNGNLSEINNAILNVKNVIKWLEAKLAEE